MTLTTNGMDVDDLGDAPNGPALALSLGNQIDAFYGGAVANAAALPALGDFPGQRKFITDTKEVATWNGTAWTGYTVAFTPTWSGVTLGTTGLVNTGRRQQSGKWVDISFNLTLGTGGSLSSTAFMTLDVAPLSTVVRALGSVLLVDGNVGTSSRRSATVLMSGSGPFFNVDSLTSSAAVTSTVPWTWAATDEIAGTFRYEAA